jgi:hypothetical protein
MCFGAPAIYFLIIIAIFFKNKKIKFNKNKNYFPYFKNKLFFLVYKLIAYNYLFYQSIKKCFTT